jgi:hypothetical protein
MAKYKLLANFKLLPEAQIELDQPTSGTRYGLESVFGRGFPFLGLIQQYSPQRVASAEYKHPPLQIETFPYGVIYAVEGQEVIVIAGTSHRKPGY